MPIQARHASYVDCVADALSKSSHSLSIDELLAQIETQRPLGSGARSAVYRAINKLFQAVQVAPGVFGWISVLLAGSVFRHQLSKEEVRRGYILLDELEHIVFYPDFFQTYRPDNRRVRVELFGGPTLRGEAAIERKTWSLRLGPDLARWIDQLGGQEGDDLLITVVDAFAGQYGLRLQPREIREESAIRARNARLAMLAEELVNEDRRTRPAIPAWDLAAKLIGRKAFTGLPPVDDLHYVLHEYSGLRLTEGLGYQIDHKAQALSRHVPYARRAQGAPAPGRDSASLSDTNGRRYDAQMDQSYGNDRFGADGYSSDGYGSDGFNTGDDSDSYDDLFESGFDEPFDGNEEECETYSQYLEIFHEQSPNGESPLSHEDFHLLEAELEMLVRLEQEFGRLVTEQDRRKLDLAEQLFIDPASLADLDWDMPDGEDYDDPPFWQN